MTEQTTPFKPFHPGTDYVKELRPEELKEEGDRTFVYLRGLERLAKERGIFSALAMRVERVELPNYQGVICTYQYQFLDGQIYQGSADATLQNCEGKFGLYLTAMAESRAKARALRTAFGVTLCSVEEKSDSIIVEESPNAVIEEHQVRAVNFVAKQKGLKRDSFNKILNDGFGKNDVNKLTKQEGKKLLESLNKIKAS